MTLQSKGRPKLRAEDFGSAEVATKTLNTQVLMPVYSRLEALERSVIVTLVITTPTPYTGMFPLRLPQPPWQVRYLDLASVRDLTTGQPLSIVTKPQWAYDTQGHLVLIGLVLSDATKYELAFKLEGK